MCCMRWRSRATRSTARDVQRAPQGCAVAAHLRRPAMGPLAPGSFAAELGDELRVTARQVVLGQQTQDEGRPYVRCRRRPLGVPGEVFERSVEVAQVGKQTVRLTRTRERCRADEPGASGRRSTGRSAANMRLWYALAPDDHGGGGRRGMARRHGLGSPQPKAPGPRERPWRIKAASGTCPAPVRTHPIQAGTCRFDEAPRARSLPTAREFAVAAGIHRLPGFHPARLR